MTTDPELDDKRRKAARYAQEPERFMLDALTLTMQSEHGRRTITLVGGEWRCTCPFYARRGTCSHVMAAQMLLAPLVRW